jgi:hypothetical protein
MDIPCQLRMPDLPKRKQEIKIAVVPAKSKSQKTAKKRGGAAARPKRRTRRMASPASSLSSGAADYAVVLRDPFDGPIVGIPAAFPPLPSGKARYWARGTFTTGSGGVGFVLMNPFNAIVNDLALVYQTGSTYAGTTLTTAATGVTTASSNSPHNNSNFGNGYLQYRIVSAGLRVYPTMAEIDLNGVYAMLRNPDNQTLNTFDQTNILAYEAASRLPIDSSRRPVCVLFAPVNPEELDYGVQTPHTSKACMGIMVTGTASKTFAWEAAVVVEEVGSYAHGETPSHADPDGFAAVLNAANDAGSVGFGDSLYKSGVAFAQAAAGQLAGLTSVVGAAAGRYVASSVARTLAGSYSRGTMGSGGPSIAAAGVIGASPGSKTIAWQGGHRDNYASVPTNMGVITTRYTPGSTKLRLRWGKDGRWDDGTRFTNLHQSAPPPASGWFSVSDWKEAATYGSLKIEDVTNPTLAAIVAVEEEQEPPFPTWFSEWQGSCVVQGESFAAVGLSTPDGNRSMVVVCLSTLPLAYAVFVFEDGTVGNLLNQAPTFDPNFYFCCNAGLTLPFVPSPSAAAVASTLPLKNRSKAQ